jgi:hypothetical protein
MFKFILYGLILFIIVQMVRTTMRIRSSAHSWKDDDEHKRKPEPPVISIPDVEDARFEDLTDLKDEPDQSSGQGKSAPPGEPGKPG